MSCVRGDRLTQDHQRLLIRIRRVLVRRVLALIDVVTGIRQRAQSAEVRQPPGPSEEAPRAPLGLLRNDRLVGISPPKALLQARPRYPESAWLTLLDVKGAIQQRCGGAPLRCGKGANGARLDANGSSEGCQRPRYSSRRHEIRKEGKEWRWKVFGVGMVLEIFVEAAQLLMTGRVHKSQISIPPPHPEPFRP